MGTDIYGWIEIGDEEEIGEPWDGVVKGQFLSRNYGVFAYLFGVRNSFGLEPIAARRGLPRDISPEVEHEYRKHTASMSAFSETWIGWWELQNIDWKHEVSESGYQVLTAANGQVKLYREWQLTLEMMKLLAEMYGDRFVRLVVWFDG